MAGALFTSVSTGMQALHYAPVHAERDGRVILYLHGAGGFGQSIAGLYDYPDFPSLLRDGLQLSSSVLIPVCHIGNQWDAGLISQFLNDYENAFTPPGAGYDLVGFSRGGEGAYRFAATHPERVRSLTVISARPVFELVASLAQVPVLICHGTADQRTPASEAQRMHERLQAVGTNSTLTLVKGDHFIVARILADRRIFEWHRGIT